MNLLHNFNNYKVLKYIIFSQYCKNKYFTYLMFEFSAKVKRRRSCGATIAEEQFADDWRVMIDPAGHPFCLCQMKAIMESSHFSLL
ncbi:UNVERIFIED_CONTAM: hypothetical protein C3P01_13775 [Clostridioides difficile]|nr:hypothetical protein [Clostridioides difficile]KJF62378.1 hypothetical protein TZ54_16455 [Clostridioides difficile]MDB2779379.1 hypothetical protein [Clostridioides difficile]